MMKNEAKDNDYLFEKQLNKTSDYEEALKNIATLCAKNNNHELAIEYYKKVLVLQSKDLFIPVNNQSVCLLVHLTSLEIEKYREDIYEIFEKYST